MSYAYGKHEEAERSFPNLPNGFPETSMKFTTKTVALLSLPLGKSDAIYFDDDIGGFGLRLRAAGSKNWIFQYKIGGRQRRLTFGAYPALSVEDARKTAGKFHAQVRLGQDPSAEKFENRARAEETFESILGSHLARQSKRLRPHSYKMMEGHFRVHAKPLHKRPLAAITRRDVATVLTKIAGTAGPTAANRTRSSLSAFFTWSMREGLVETNPVIATNKALENGPRERVLADDELRDIWAALADDHGDYASIVRVLTLTGARRQEIGSLTWAEVDLDRAMITLPGAKTKNKRAFELPLNSAALEILRRREKVDGRDFVFGRGAAGFRGWSACKRVLDARIAMTRKKPMDPWSLHDLRRTVSTVMHDRLGVQPHIVEACLNHVGHQSGVAGVYNRASYIGEKQQAFDRWGVYVASIIEGRESNVVPLRA